jgi:autophagy-related protein 17
VEVERRDGFREKQGEYLPIDIWPGIMNAPVQFEIAATGEEAKNLPELKKDVVEQALRRMEERARLT